MTGGSRALIKKYFCEVEPYVLPPGHSAISLTEGQLSTILKVVAEETARSSYEKMESLIVNAGMLNLQGLTTSKSHPQGFQMKRASPGGYESVYGAQSVEASDTSGVLRSDVDFASIGYAYEYSDRGEKLSTTPPSGIPGWSQRNPRSSSYSQRLQQAAIKGGRLGKRV